MALRARLRHRLASEARRVAGVLLRLADEAEPARPGTTPGGPPAHWLAVVRARAPQLLEGRGIGARLEDAEGPAMNTPRAEPQAWPGPPDGPRAGPARAERPIPAGAGAPDWPRSPLAAGGEPDWPRVRPAGRAEPGWPPLGVAEVDTASWPQLPPAVARGPDWPHEAGASAPAQSLDDTAGSSSVPPSASWPDRAEARRAVHGRWPVRRDPAPVQPTFPAAGAPPTTVWAAWPATVELAARPAARPAAPSPAPAVAAPTNLDGGVAGWWPALPDAGEQHVPPPALDLTDADRVRRLDAEQRGA